MLPYAALVFTIWAVVAGERWALPAATLLTSFLMQTHVGYVALAVPLLAAGAAWAVGAAVVDRRRRAHDPDTQPGAAVVAPDDVAGDPAREADPEPADAEPGDPQRGDPEPDTDAAERGAGSSGGLLGPLVVSAAIGVLMWLPPVVQQVTHAQGNVDRIVEWFREGDDAARTLLEGWRVVADQYTWPPEWIAGQAPLAFGNEPAAVYDRVVPILLLAVLAAAGYLWWRRGRPARALVATWILASAVAVVATSRTVGPLYAYRLHWVWALGMVGGVLVGWAAWTLATWGTGARARQVSIAVAFAALAALTVATSADAVRAEPPGAAAGELLAELAPETEAALAEMPGDGPVLVQMASFGAIGTGLGLVDELERAGVDAVVEDTGAGEHRNHRDGEPVRATLLVGVDVDVVPISRLAEHELIALAGTDMEQLEAEAAVNERLAREAAEGTLTLDDLRRVAGDQPPPYSAGAVFLVTPSPGP